MSLTSALITTEKATERKPNHEKLVIGYSLRIRRGDVSRNRRHASRILRAVPFRNGAYRDGRYARLRRAHEPAPQRRQRLHAHRAVAERWMEGVHQADGEPYMGGPSRMGGTGFVPSVSEAAWYHLPQRIIFARV